MSFTISSCHIKLLRFNICISVNSIVWLVFILVLKNYSDFFYNLNLYRKGVNFGTRILLCIRLVSENNLFRNIFLKYILQLLKCMLQSILSKVCSHLSSFFWDTMILLKFLLCRLSVILSTSTFQSKKLYQVRIVFLSVDDTFEMYFTQSWPWIFTGLENTEFTISKIKLASDFNKWHSNCLSLISLDAEPTWYFDLLFSRSEPRLRLC